MLNWWFFSYWFVWKATINIYSIYGHFEPKFAPQWAWAFQNALKLTFCLIKCITYKHSGIIIHTNLKLNLLLHFDIVHLNLYGKFSHTLHDYFNVLNYFSRHNLLNLMGFSPKGHREVVIGAWNCFKYYFKSKPCKIISNNL